MPQLPQPITETDGIDTDRDVWAWLHTHGLPANRLIDPGLFTLADFEAVTDLRLVKWDDSGPTEFPIDLDNLTTDTRLDEASGAVVYGNRNAEQPIGFGRPLNSGRVLEADGTPTDEVTVFALGDRDYPDLSARDVIDALGRVRYHTPLRRPTIETWCAALGVDDISVTSWNDDAHGDWMRAEYLPQRLVAQIEEITTESPDSDISGHSKRGRQRFNRNLSQLEQWGRGDA